ncbi:alpha/beta fold hydrolase [Kribbella sp. NPDC004875]|uniref:alpha/beta fold hydrolase n=1 Tax=Kribbella sp. NPDC004875 TaxID=3364107 RepID=UPI0036A7B20C
MGARVRNLICLHAGTSGPSTWDRFVPSFEELGYRVFCPALLGHGTVPRRRPYRLDDFCDQILRDQVLRELDGPVTFVGNSLGAFVASAVGHRIHSSHPDEWLAIVREFLAFKGA